MAKISKSNSYTNSSEVESTSEVQPTIEIKNSFSVLAVSNASYAPVVTISNPVLPIANVPTTVNGTLSVTFSPTSAISSVSLSQLVLSGTGGAVFGAITVTPALPVTMTSANSVAFSFPYSNTSFTGIYIGSNVSDTFNLSGLYLNASLNAGSTDTIAVGLTSNYGVYSTKTESWVYNTRAEHSRLYVNGEI